MSEGLKALLEAAQFLEQQEKLKLSPQTATAIPALLNEQHQRFIVQAAYDATLAAAAAASSTTTTATTTTNNNNNNNNSSTNSINGINIRNSNIRHGSSSSNSNNAGTIHQVSSSAPAAAATFQHINGHHSHHNNSTSLHLHHTPTTVLTNGTTTATTIATTTNSHHSHVSPAQPLSFNHHQQQQQQQNSQLLNANHHDYEFNGIGGNGANSVGVTIITANTSQQQQATSSASPLNSRTVESGRIITDDANKGDKNCNYNASIMLVTNNLTKTNKLATRISSSSSSPTPSLSPPIPMATDDDQIEPNTILDNSQTEVTPMDTTTNIISTTANSRGSSATTTFTLIGSNGEILGNTAASKQVLLANGIRLAGAPQQQNVALSKSINIPSSFNNKTVPIITGISYQLPASLSHQTTSTTAAAAPQQQQQILSHLSGNGGGNISILTNRNKTFIPLTPPPMSSRKFIEPTQARIRSFSLSSHKFSANNHHLHHQLHVQNPNNNNSMMVDDIPPTSTSHQQQQHSPPRHASTSGVSHYMQMISTATGGGQQQTTVGGVVTSGSNHVTHATPRRRTISSTSNGAGTREVHNKLEKNRRAHLKECYEQLKNELSLKDEDRRKTSNLAILGEALKCVQYLNNRNQEVDAEWEHLANEKINLQKRFVSLKRELGPKYEQMFSGIFPDNEIGSIPNERENINDTHSLASGRGSALYSSSSSLSSGGSNGSSNSNGSSGNNTMSSPVGAGLQTAMPTTISPVINKINHKVNTTTTSPISISNNNVVIQQQQQQQQRKNPLNSNNSTIQAVAIPATHHQGSSGGINVNSPPAAGSPTALITFGNSLPLSLTAKNISATAVTRGSPTPSTPSPSPSSSSGVSSSSSLISSSPPINGVINNGRNVTVNIPNGLKLHATGAGPNTGTAATILATSAPAQGVNNTNNAIMLQALRGCHLV